jgi:sulfur-oxidizing protein SoxX
MLCRRSWAVAIGVVVVLETVGCVATTSAPAAASAQAMLKSSFENKGQATLDRLAQDPIQQACSGASAPSDDVVEQLQKVEMATIKPPADGKYLGDWRQGEKLAQNGRGMTWSDPPTAPNGGNCYNCHQIAKAEISYGTIGPSLYNYGKLRGVVDPASAGAAPIVQYTWGKLYNAKAYNACSTMPRFGQAHLLTAEQMQDLMALLLDPKSPVNQ